MARAARAAGLAAVALDLRGHGDTGGTLDTRVLDDIASIAALVPKPLILRGSSLGGYLAIAAAERAGAAAIIAICPAPGEGLARLFPDLGGFFTEHDLGLIVEQSSVPLLLIHAEGDERVPFQHSVELHERSASTRKRLLLVPGGHHRSVQHDQELQGEALRFARRAVGPGQQQH
jgi:alpha-beta hydrolase superfamily lysophospholipase